MTSPNTKPAPDDVAMSGLALRIVTDLGEAPREHETTAMFVERVLAELIAAKRSARPVGGPSVDELAQVLYEAQARLTGAVSSWDVLSPPLRQTYVRGVLAVFDAARVTL